MKIREKLGYIKYYISTGVSILLFIKYNYFCKHIKRTKGSYVIPYKNAVLEFGKGSVIELTGRLQIGFNRLKHSKIETDLRLDPGAKWVCKNGAILFFGTTVDIKKDAIFESGFFSANTGSVLIVHKYMRFGEDVMLGRNIMVYDSDHHQLRDENDVPINPPEPVIIEDHVWLTSNINIMKGVRIGKDSLIAAQTVVTKDIPPHSIAAGRANASVVKDYVNWSRESCPME